MVAQPHLRQTWLSGTPKSASADVPPSWIGLMNASDVVRAYFLRFPLTQATKQGSLLSLNHHQKTGHWENIARPCSLNSRPNSTQVAIRAPCGTLWRNRNLRSRLGPGQIAATYENARRLGEVLLDTFPNVRGCVQIRRCSCNLLFSFLSGMYAVFHVRTEMNRRHA